MQESSVFYDFDRVLLLAGGVAFLFFLLLLVIVVLLILRRSTRRVEPPPVDLTIDIRRFPAGGPPEHGPQLQIYGTPVRLTAIVLAPAGRNSSLPAQDRLPQLLEALLPGLSEVFAVHEPELRCWPSQLSTQGFTHSFFNFVPLPGDRGKGSPWCCVAGRFETGSQQLLAGLVCCAASPNSLSQIVVQHEGQWMDVVRVKREA